MEERILFKELKELPDEFPDCPDQFPNIRELLDFILPKYGFKLEKYVNVRNPTQAYYHNKALYFRAEFKEEKGLFLGMVGIGFDGNTLQVIKNPAVD